MIAVLLAAATGFSIFMLLENLHNLKKLKYAKEVLYNVEVLYRTGMISYPQAKVFINDLENPLDINSVHAVRLQLDKIVEEHIETQNTNRQLPT